MSPVIVYLAVLCLLLSCLVGLLAGWGIHKWRSEPDDYKLDIDFTALRDAFKPPARLGKIDRIKPWPRPPEV